MAHPRPDGLAVWRAKTTLRRLFLGVATFSGALLALAPVHTTALAGALLFVVGAGWTTWSSQAMAHVQTAAPDQLRGRVISLYMYSLIATAPFGGLLGGWLAAVGGTGLAFAVSGSACLAAAAVGAFALRPRILSRLTDFAATMWP